MDRFSLKQTWENYDSDKQIQRKAEYILSLIPKDVKTIIDVGCGNGIITNLLADKFEVMGLDISETALMSLKCPFIVSSATKIPCEDAAYDLVLSSEMLEHLNNDDLILAIIELKRVSKKYILISVPNNEYLSVSFVKCPKCTAVFHAWHHFQSFDKKTLCTLFKDHFRLIHFSLIGLRQQRWIPQLLRIKHHIGQWFDPGEKSICAVCGNTEFKVNRKNIITKICNGLNKALAGKKPYWQVACFEKNK